MIRPLVLAIFGGFLLWMSLRSLRSQRLQERYVLLFIATGLPFLVLAVWPDGIVWLSEKMNMEKPTLMVFCLGSFTIVLLLKLFSIISVQQRQIASLAQMVGILTQKQPFSPPGAPPSGSLSAGNFQVPGSIPTNIPENLSEMISEAHQSEDLRSESETSEEG